MILTDNEEATSSWSNESIPESDSTPHINVGNDFQCIIPPCSLGYGRPSQESNHEDLLWDPGINKHTDSEGKLLSYFLIIQLETNCANLIFLLVDMYLDFACCAAVPGGGRNREYAMHLLHLCGGNIHVSHYLITYKCI